MDQLVEQAAAAIQSASVLWIGAGAGMGVDSGLPDFRGDEGFWRAYPPFRQLNLSFYDLANPVWFHQKPEQAWGFYGHRLQLYRRTPPHPGFEILLKWARRKSDRSFVYTSNVDGHFQSAGFDEAEVYECHGSIHHLQCSEPCHDGIWSATDWEPDIDETTMLANGPLPACPKCGAVARPNILMFGDWNWLDQRSEIQSNRYETWKRNQGAGLVALEFGAGTAVPSVRIECHRQSGTAIRVNPREPDIRSGISMPMGALEFLTAVDQLIS